MLHCELDLGSVHHTGCLLESTRESQAGSSTLLNEEAPAPSSVFGRAAPALAFPQFRNFFFGSIAANSAQQIVTIATGWLIYDITNDNAVYLAYAGLAIALPGLTLSLFGGAIADRVDLRRLLIGTQVFQAVMAAILTVLAATGIVTAWQILALSFFIGAGQAFNNPARQVVVPQLVNRVALPSAVSLNALTWHGCRVIAPAVGGLVIAFAGVAVAFLFCALGYLAFAFVTNTFTLLPRERRDSRVLKEIGEGLRYIWQFRIFAVLIGLNFCLSFFGISVLQIFPVFAKDVLDVGAEGLGLMFSALGIGSVVGLILATTLASYERRGLLILCGAAVYGVTLIVFSFSPSYPAALVALFFVGGSSQICMNAIQTALHLQAPDHLRGRIMGTYTMTFNMGPLGATQAGALAAVFGAAVAVQVGGAVIIFVGLLLLFANPALRRLQSEPEAVAA
jgi:MFS family permease